MGLFSKIKNVLFEEEEIEIPVFKKEETKEEVVQAKPARTYERYEKAKLEEKPKPKEVKKEPEVVVEDNEREIFKTEPTFRFLMKVNLKKLKRVEIVLKMSSPKRRIFVK